MKIIIALLLVVAAGCVQDYTPVTELSIPGHGSQIYTFSNDIRESLRVKTNDPEGIKAVAASTDVMALVFDGSSQQDNAYFTVVVTNLDQKIPIFYSYERKLFSFEPFYYVGDQWYDKNGENITTPSFTAPVLWLRGPSTGATDTSVNLVDNAIYLSGTSYKNLTLAGDKLTLLFFGIDRI